MTTLHNHLALDDFISELAKPKVDEVLIFTYFIGTSVKLDTLYHLLVSKPHTIYCGYTAYTKHDAHSACLDLLLIHPKLNVRLLPDCHVKLWAIRRGKCWTSWAGSYNLVPTRTAQLTLRFRGAVHSTIHTSLSSKVDPMGNPDFAGLPIGPMKKTTRGLIT